MTITISYIDHDGVTTETRCRDQHHADMMVLTLAAEGLEHWVGCSDAESVRYEFRGFGKAQPTPTAAKAPALLRPPPEIADSAKVRLGDGFISAEFPPLPAKAK